MVGESPAGPPRRAASSPSAGSPHTVRAGALALSGLLLAFALAAMPTGAPAATSGYGKLIASSRDGTASTAEADFHLVSQPRVFWLLVSDRTGAKVTISWSISCVNAARGERGGAAGKATIGSGRWVKRIRADWIKRPAACSGVVRGSAGRSPVQIHVYAG
jgi:hypothetical protein